jgi:hypothetical protein
MAHGANELAEEASYLITIMIIPSLLHPDETPVGSLEKQNAIVFDAPGYIRTLQFGMLGEYEHTPPVPVGQFVHKSHPHRLPPPPLKPLPLLNTCVVMHEFFHAPHRLMLQDLGKEVDGYFVYGKCEMHVWKLEKTHGDGMLFEG